MNPIQADQLLNQLNWRYATKQFDASKTIPQAHWSALEESLLLTPTSYGLQPFKFLVLTDKTTREQLVPVSWNQRQVVDSSHLVVFAIKTTIDESHVDRFIERIAEVRGGEVSSLDFYRKMIVGDVIQGPRSKMVGEWAARQAYIALGNFMTSAALLGIDTCPLEGFDPGQYDAILNLKELGLASVVACAAGYRASEDKYAAAPKVRLPAEEIFHRI